MAPTADDYCRAAVAAAGSWGMAPRSASILNHSENVVVRLDLDAGPTVMRLHRPGYNTVDELESEVVWVRSLADVGIAVPAAVPMPDGGHYRPVRIPVAGGPGETRQAGVVEWIDGRPLGGPIEGGDAGSVEHFGAVGALTARIRHHHRTWTSPTGFVRRRWDANGFVGEPPLWGRFWEVEVLSEHQRRLFIRARDGLRSELGALSTGPDRFGLIHADLHLGNLMVDGDRLTIIDFDDAGWGWFAHELAVALYSAYGEPWYDDARAALLEGYRTVHPIGDDEVALIDTFFAVRALMIVGWLAARPELAVHEHFATVVEEAEEACRVYLARS